MPGPIENAQEDSNYLPITTFLYISEAFPVFFLLLRDSDRPLHIFRQRAKVSVTV